MNGLLSKVYPKMANKHVKKKKSQHKVIANENHQIPLHITRMATIEKTVKYVRNWNIYTLVMTM